MPLKKARPRRAISSPHDSDTAIDQTAGLGILTTESCRFVFQPASAKRKGQKLYRLIVAH
jgi:hypothetical protein